jgi:hypothetical protein
MNKIIMDSIREVLAGREYTEEVAKAIEGSQELLQTF